jgi:hypothetical protein
VKKIIVCARQRPLAGSDDERLLARLKMGDAMPLRRWRGFRPHYEGQFFVTPLRPSASSRLLLQNLKKKKKRRQYECKHDHMIYSKFFGATFNFKLVFPLSRESHRRAGVELQASSLDRQLTTVLLDRCFTLCLCVVRLSGLRRGSCVIVRYESLTILLKGSAIH